MGEWRLPKKINFVRVTRASVVIAPSTPKGWRSIKGSCLAPSFWLHASLSPNIRFLLFFPISEHSFIRIYHIYINLLCHSLPTHRPVPHHTIPAITMKYSAVILALVAGVFAVPQASITSAPSAPRPSGLTPQVSCALDCTPGDVMCQAACLGNARPNASQIVDTNKCAAACDQGSGSKQDSDAYGVCQQSCIASFFPSSQTAFAPGAGQVASGSAGAQATTGSVRPTASAGKSNWLCTQKLAQSNILSRFIWRSDVCLWIWRCTPIHRSC
jgi:hypothetical protein